MTKGEISALAERAKNKDKKAFEALYNEYKNKVYFFALRYVKSTGTAEDMTSETFVTAFENIQALRQNESFVGWLYTICYNKCIHYIKEETKTERIDDDNALDTSEINDAVMLPDDYAVNEQTKVQLREMIDSLDTKSRSAIIMYYYDELSIKDIAKAQGISENAADLRLFRARKKLKKQIEKLFSKGSMLIAFPLSALLENISFDGFAAKGSKAAVKKSLAMKIAAISAAGVIAVSAGIVLLKKQFGDDRLVYSDLSLGLGTVNVCDEGILSSERGFVHFTDFAGGESAVLCSKPDCRHDDESCYAYFDEPVFEDIYSGFLYVVDNGDTLNGSRLFKCNTDGSDRKVIAELDCQGALGMTYVMKGGRLFCFTFNVDTQTNDMTYYPTIIDLENGKASKGEALIDGFKMLYADGERMYYSFLETKTDLNEYMQNHTSDEIDKYISNPDNLSFELMCYDGEKVRQISGFDSKLQAIYYDGENAIAFEPDSNTYYLTDLNGNKKSKLISSPASTGLYMYGTAIFTDTLGNVHYYDKQSEALVNTSSKQIPQLVFGKRVIFSADEYCTLDTWISGKVDEQRQTAPIKLDDEYFETHWQGKRVLHVYSDLSITDTDNAAFNDRLALLGKGYVVSFDMAGRYDTALEYTEQLKSMKNSNTGIDIFATPALSEGEDTKPYTLSIKEGLCEELDDRLSKGGGLYSLYPENNWKSVTREKKIYGVNNRINISAGLCFDLKMQFEGDCPQEISKTSDLENILLQNSKDSPAMYLDKILAEHIKNQNGELIGGCIPIRLENGELMAFDPYSTEFFEDYVEFAHKGRAEGFIGNDVFAPFTAGNRSPKSTGTSQIIISGMEDHTALFESGIWCIASWSKNKDDAYDLLETTARDELLNDILYYGVPNITYESDGYRLSLKDDNFGALATLGSEYLLIENKPYQAQIKAYNDSLKMLDISGYSFEQFEKDFEKYRTIIGKYESILTGDDKEYKAHFKALKKELENAGYQKTIEKINEILKSK